MLRERIKTIEKELGEGDENKEYKELADKIKSTPSDRRTRESGERTVTAHSDVTV